MAIKNIIISAFAVAAFSSIAMAQTEQPNQPSEKVMRKPGVQRMEKGKRTNRRQGMGMRRGMRGGAMGMRRGSMRMMNFDRLNLTDAQKQRIQAIQASSRGSREANKSQFEEMGNLMRLKREGLLTSEQGTRLTALQAQMQTQMKANMEKMQADILSVLTPDQKTLLNQMRNQRSGGRGMRGGMMRPGQPGMKNEGIAPAPTDN